MAEIKKGKFCWRCKMQVLHVANGPSHLIHFILSAITVGAWLPVWALVAVLPSKFICSQCGTAYNWGKARRVKRKA